LQWENWVNIMAETKPDMSNYIPDLDDMYCIIYTSGTTGNPKGAIYSYRGIAHIKKIAKLDIHLTEGYGQTENLGFASRGIPGEHKVGSAGRPMSFVDIKISEEGEILTRSNVIMAGYYKNPEATKEAFTEDGYLHTGDMGHFDEEGNLFIHGCFKDPFKIDKGEFINPVPIEGKFLRHQYIEQLCLIGISLVQPVLLVVFSEVAKKLNREEINKSLQETLDEINPELTPFQKITHIIVVKDPWTPENDLMTTSLKVKHNAVHNRYIDLAHMVVKHPETIVWEE